MNRRRAHFSRWKSTAPCRSRENRLRRALISFFALLILALPYFFLARTGESAKESSVSLDLLVRQVEDLTQETARILEDQKEILDTIKNLKVWAHRN